jgi:hypothetical protein
MSKNNLKPTRWYYVLAILIPIFACLGTTLLVYQNVPELPGALEAIGIKNLTQVIVPGSADVNFSKAGAYAVYYEYRTAFDGVNYYRDEYPPSMKCQLRSKATGEAVRLAPSNVQGNVYTSHYPDRAGVMYKQISIDQPGVYTFSCENRDGRPYPESVLAVGPNLVWEFFNVALKPIAAFLTGTFTFVSACGISILIIGIVALKRHQSKNK